MKSGLFIIVILITMGMGQDTATPQNTDGATGYKIEQPGTITFTAGVKIIGKVEKPQVMIFLPKEKSVFREMTFEYSFKDDIMKPMTFIPVIE